MFPGHEMLRFGFLGLNHYYFTENCRVPILQVIAVGTGQLLLGNGMECKCIDRENNQGNIQIRMNL